MKTASTVHDRGFVVFNGLRPRGSSKHVNNPREGFSIRHQKALYRTSGPMAGCNTALICTVRYVQAVLIQVEHFVGLCFHVSGIEKSPYESNPRMTEWANLETRSPIYLMIHNSCGKYTPDRCEKCVANTKRWAPQTNVQQLSSLLNQTPQKREMRILLPPSYIPLRPIYAEVAGLLTSRAYVLYRLPITRLNTQHMYRCLK